MSRPAVLPIEAIGWHQRLVVNPLVAILSSLGKVLPTARERRP